VESSSCGRSSNTMLCRKDDFLNGFRTTMEAELAVASKSVAFLLSAGLVAAVSVDLRVLRGSDAPGT